MSFLDDIGVCQQSGCEAIAIDCGETYLLIGRAALFRNINFSTIRVDDGQFLLNLLDRFGKDTASQQSLEFLYNLLKGSFNQSTDPQQVRTYFSKVLGSAVVALQLAKITGGENQYADSQRERLTGEEPMTDRMLFVLNRCVDSYLGDQVKSQIADLFNPTNILVTAATLVGVALVSSTGVGTAVMTAVGFAMKGWEIFGIIRSLVSFIEAFMVNDPETAAQILALALAALGAVVIGLFLRRVGAKVKRPRPNLDRPPEGSDFSDASKEIKFDAPRPASTGSTTVRSRTQDAVNDARAAGFVDQAGNPTGVDIAGGPHRRAPDIRASTGHTGQTRQSAHIGATTFLDSLPGYRRNDAFTVQLDPSTHRSFDNNWMAWKRATRAARPSQQATLSEALNAQRAALQQTSNLTQRQKDTLSWLLEREYAELSHGLPMGMATLIPL